MKKLLIIICAAIAINTAAVDLKISQNHIFATHIRSNGNTIRMTKNLQSNAFTYSEESPQERENRLMQFMQGVSLTGAFIFGDPDEQPLDLNTQDTLYRRMIRTINLHHRLHEEKLEKNAYFSTEIINAQDDPLEIARDRVRAREEIAQRDLRGRVAFTRKERLEQLIEQLLPEQTTQKLRHLRAIRNRLKDIRIKAFKNVSQIELNNIIIETMVALTKKHFRAPKDQEIIRYIQKQYSI